MQLVYGSRSLGIGSSAFGRPLLREEPRWTDPATAATRGTATATAQ